MEFVINMCRVSVDKPKEGNLLARYMSILRIILKWNLKKQVMF